MYTSVARRTVLKTLLSGRARQRGVLLGLGEAGFPFSYLIPSVFFPVGVRAGDISLSLQSRLG